jgi:hypothetical protein
MHSQSPTVSVLISTFNRSRLLRRAVGSVLMQTFHDFEIVVIDDYSSDDTPAVVASMGDTRIRYFRNETNVGSKHGDRPHVRRFLNELMRGKYFVYLCDDDYWLPPDLLERQVALFRDNPGLAFVFGNQLSYDLGPPDSYFGRSDGSTTTFTWENLGKYFDVETLQCKTPHMNYFKQLCPKPLMTSEEYLTCFSRWPVGLNRADGATLYSRERFMEAGAMRDSVGSQWQAGFEFKMGPACLGGVAFLDEPALLTEIRAQNASFRRTQVEHYLDSVKAIDIAMGPPMERATAERRRFLKHIKNESIRGLTHSYLGNTWAIRRYGSLGMCSAENMAHPVTYRQVIPTYWRNTMWPTRRDFKMALDAEVAPYAEASRRAVRKARKYSETIRLWSKKVRHGK